MMEYDVVVVGGGAAGLSAAMVLARARRRVAVVDAGEPRNAPAAHLHGFLSRDGMSPAQLLAVGRGEVVGYGGELPEVPGLRERWGNDVLHCPYCHGYEVRDAPIGALGGDVRELSLHHAVLLRQWSDDVVFFPNRIALTADERERLTARGIRIVDGEVARLVVDDDQLSGVELADGQVVSRVAVFVGPRFVPQDELLTSLGCEVGENGWVATDPTGRTSVTGVWAAGNVVDSPAQMITAAGAGSTAAIAINRYLLEQDVQQAVTDYHVSQVSTSLSTSSALPST